MNIQLKYKMNSNSVNIACIVHIVLLLLNSLTNSLSGWSSFQQRRNFGFDFRFRNTGLRGRSLQRHRNKDFGDFGPQKCKFVVTLAQHTHSRHDRWCKNLQQHSVAL